MSVLARPQGTPERVWSYVAGLSALGGKAERGLIESLVNPGYLRDGQTVVTATSLANDIYGAASSLKLIQGDRHHVELADGLAVSDLDAFADTLHSRFCASTTDDSNRVMLETYAWFVAESDRQGNLEWLFEWGTDDFVKGACNALLGDDEDGLLMNRTKLVPWRRWMALLGLMVQLPLTRHAEYPNATVRTLRELATVGLQSGQRLTSTEFLQALAARQPYFDTGRLFVQACDRMKHAPKPGRLSPILSGALRDLHDSQAIELTLAGDSGEGLALTGNDDHPVTAFNGVVIKTVGDAA